MTSSGSRILHSWKEISNYIGMGVRTVQRYETKLDLPVHRPAGRIRSAVLAFADELDIWVVQIPVRRAQDRQADAKAERAS
jgi:hypothetical protein